MISTKPIYTKSMFELVNDIKELTHKYNVQTKFKQEHPEAQNALIETVTLAIIAFPLLFLLLVVLLYIFSVYYLIKHWKTLPTWAKFVTILPLISTLPFSPILTIVVVYIAKDSNNSGNNNTRNTNNVTRNIQNSIRNSRDNIRNARDNIRNRRDIRYTQIE